MYQSRGTPESMWVPIYGTVYTGANVCVDETGVGNTFAMIQLPVASSTYNASNYDTPFGNVIGNNLRRPLTNATYGIPYIAWVTPLASTTEYVSSGGTEPGGARVPMVKCTLIDPTTILRTGLWVTTPGGALVVSSTVTADAEGDAFTSTAATAFTPLDGLCTIYFRSGANKGSYRRMDSVDTTAHAWNNPTYAAVASGDTAVIVNLPPRGFGKAQLAATYCTGFDVADGCASNYYGVDIINLNLAEAGNEFAEFRWNIMNFSPLADARS